MILALLYLVIFAQAQESLEAPCDTKQLEEFCQKLESVGNDEVIQFENGTQIPGCVLNAPLDAVHRKEEEGERIVKARMAAALSEIPSDLIPESERDFLLSNPHFLHFDTPAEKIYSWPPLGKHSQMVVTDEMLEDWKSKFPANFRELWISSMAELDSLRKTTSLIDRVKIRTLHPQDTEKRIARLFEFSKNSIRSKILSGRAPNSLSEEDQALIQRIDTLKLRGQDSSFDRMCGPGYTAFYSLDTHDIGIPPGHDFMPDDALVRMISHEIAHAIDRCSSSRSLLGENGRFGIEGSDFDGSSRIAASAVPPQKYRFNSVYQCLASEKGGSFGSSEPQKETGSDCTQDTHDEAFCDWMATAAVADHLADPTTPSLGEQLPRLLFLTSRIKYKVPKKLESVFYNLDRACSDRNDPQAPGSHPTWVRRYFDILLRQPAIAMKVGCEVNTKPCLFPGSNAAQSIAPAKAQATP